MHSQDRGLVQSLNKTWEWIITKNLTDLGSKSGTLFMFSNKTTSLVHRNSAHSLESWALDWPLNKSKGVNNDTPDVILDESIFHDFYQNYVSCTLTHRAFTGLCIWSSFEQNWRVFLTVTNLTPYRIKFVNAQRLFSQKLYLMCFKIILPSISLCLEDHAIDKALKRLKETWQTWQTWYFEGCLYNFHLACFRICLPIEVL